MKVKVKPVNIRINVYNKGIEEVKVMGLFGKRGGIFGGSFGGGLFNDEPNVLDKVEMLFTDVETEGKKKGYDRAA